MDAAADATDQERALLAELARAIEQAPRPVREIAAGIPLSIALGRLRPAVSCGGCSTPLEFQGIPARTDARLRAPFELVLSDADAVRS
jgi:hypothetical protein